MKDKPLGVLDVKSRGSLDDDVFVVGKGDATFEPKEVETLTMATPAWRSPSHESYACTPMLWHLLLQNRSFDDECLGRLNRHWLSLLARPMTLLQKGNAGPGGLCVFACEWGVLLWRVKLHVVQGERFYTLQVRRGAGSHSWAFATIDDPEEWTAADAHALSPAVFAAKAHSLKGKLPAALAFTIGKRSKILTLSAKTGFKHMTLDHLKDLMNYLGMTFAKGKRPTKKCDVVEVLVKKVLGETADVEAALNAREEEPEVGTILGSDNLEAVQGMLDEDDAKEAGGC